MSSRRSTWKQSARNRLFRALYLEHQDQSNYLQIISATHQQATILYGGATITFRRHYTFVTPVETSEHTLTFPEWSLLALLADELTQAVWAGYHNRLGVRLAERGMVYDTPEQVSEAYIRECTHPRLLSASRVKVVYLYGGFTICYHRDKGLQTKVEELPFQLDQQAQAFLSALGREITTAVDRGHKEAATLRAGNLKRRRLIKRSNWRQPDLFE